MREHRDAIEASLRFHCAGLSLAALGTARLTWPDLRAILAWLPSTSPFKRATEPEWAGWGIAEQQRAVQIDALQGANWQRGHAKGEPPPPPSWRPQQVAADRDKAARNKERERRHVAALAARQREG